MSDGAPLDRIEQMNAMRDLAAVMRGFYQGLKDEGFSDAEALRLTEAYIRSMASGASGS